VTTEPTRPTDKRPAARLVRHSPKGDGGRVKTKGTHFSKEFRPDVVAHLGGFITRMLLGLRLTATPRLAHQPRINLAAGILFATLVILPWWLGLNLPNPAR